MSALNKLTLFVCCFCFHAFAQTGQQQSQPQFIVYPKIAPSHINGNCEFSDMGIDLSTADGREEIFSTLAMKGFSFNESAPLSLKLRLACQFQTHDFTGRLYTKEFGQCSSTVYSGREIIFESEVILVKNDNFALEEAVRIFVKELPTCSY